MARRVYATRPLVKTCCRLAADADPQPVNVSLSAAAAGDLVPAGDGLALSELGPDEPVFSEFYFPGAGESLSAVFGMDLATPAGTDGRFLSHPDGLPDVSVTDDLHARILVAVPPYEPEEVRAFDRNGRRLDLCLVAARSADENFEG
jgi:hypothetical protein